MADRLIVDLNPDGTASVATQLDGDDFYDYGPSFEVTWPLDNDELDELRWYLEDYLRLPSGVYGERGQRVRGRLAQWGAEVFTAIFDAGPGRDAYLRLLDRPAGTRLVFRSADPRMLALPWELMRDPARPTPLALDLAGVSRSLPAGQLPDTVPVPGGKLRVLMVIARPEGERDVGYQMIARPLLERLHAVSGEVELVVLRPPTLDELTRTLAQAPFHVVHFDGHGIHNGRWFLTQDPRDLFASQPDEGVLVFEKPGGGADPVAAATVARVLSEARVPVVVLNACQSGAIGNDLGAAIATRLLQEGIASVVAMAYTVYAVAAAEFMAAFYERLFAGDPVSAAVTAGRKRLSARNGRPSRKGDMPLEDWLIPVHYLRRDISFPQVRVDRTGPLSLDEELDQIRAAASGQGTEDLDPVGTFTGRDWLTCQLEVAARLQKVVVLYGPGGTGKTELVKAFGRWWRDTGGVEDPRFVFFHSFEPGAATFGLDGVVNEIGRSLFGTEFDRQQPAERRAVVEKVLTERRMLLIWDNFETVRSMPESKPLIDDDDCRELREFLTRLATKSNSAVLITSRSPEPWLGDLRRVTVGGLTPLEADQYATTLLEPYPAARDRRRKPAFGDLMEWLDGHPLSMRLILPHLETTAPDTLLDVLRGTAPLPGTTEEDGDRLTSLPASIAYSYTHLSEHTRRLLPAISLLQGVAHTVFLALFSKVLDVPERFSGVGMADWRHALDDAASVGLLTPLGGDVYRIHPALPAYLAAEWRGDREAATHALVPACALFGSYLYGYIKSGEARGAFIMIGLNRRTFGSLISYALDHELWIEAGMIFGPLESYCNARGFTEEADAWANRIRLATEDATGTPPDIDSRAGMLWMAAADAQASRQCARFQLGPANATYQQMRVLLEAHPAQEKWQAHLTAIYHGIGTIALLEGRLDDAEEWYRQSLAIKEQLGDTEGRATIYCQLGVIARDRGRLHDAEAWYHKALIILEKLGDKILIAKAYNALGAITYLQARLDEAEDWYSKAFTINEEIGNKPELAMNYHQQGLVVRKRGRIDDSEEWIRKSLAIEEELGNKHGIAASYHELGNTAYAQARLDDAENWYYKALKIHEQLGDTSGIIKAFTQLSSLAGKRGRAGQELEWTVRWVTVFDEFPHPLTRPGPENLATLAKHLGIGALEETWLRVTGKPLPQTVREYVEHD